MNDENLNSILINKRKELGVSQSQLVEQLQFNITRQYYGMIELGHRTPSVKVAKSIAQILDIPWTIFFEMERN